MKVRLPILALVAIVIAAACSQPYSPTKVTSIAVSAAGELGSLYSSEIRQFSAKVLPANASDLSVTWSLTDSSGSSTTDATIDANGILSVSSDLAGMPRTVVVIATANDGSGVSGSLDVSLTPPN